MDELLETLGEISSDITTLKCNPMSTLDERILDILDELTDSVTEIVRHLKE